MPEYRMADVDDVSGLLGPTMSFLKRTVRYIAASVKRYALVAVVVFLCFVGYSVYQKMNKPVLYEGKMGCFHNHLSKKEYGEMIDKLSTLAITHSWQSLATQLNISLAEAKTIVSIEGQSTSGIPMSADKMPGTSPFYINLRATERGVFAPFERGVVDYLNRMPFRSTRNIQDQERQAAKEALLRDDINLVDSVLSAYVIHLRSPAVVMDSSTKLADIVPLISYKEGLEDRMLDQKLKRSQTQSVELFENFIVPDSPSPINPKYGMKLMALAGLLCGCLAAVLCSLILGDKRNEKKQVYEQSAVIQPA